MARFTGRSSDTLDIPEKPIPVGFKIWALAQKGYILHWIYYQKGKKGGPVGVHPPKPLNPTNAVVPACLSELKDQPYHVWLDNLFISHKLLAYFRKHDWGAAGTARPNSGMRQKLIELKKEEKTKDIYPWERLFSGISDDNLVMQFAWKDNSLCLFQSTIHTGFESDIIRARKRPSETSTKAKTARVPFGDDPVKDLPVPSFIDEYNHNMNHVDQADHLRSSYDTNSQFR